MSKVGYVYDDKMLLHSGKDQYENPERIKAIYDKLKKDNYLDKMIFIESKQITKNELLLAHDSKFIDNIYELFTKDERFIKKDLFKRNSMFGNKYSLQSAEIAAGSTLNLTMNLLDGKIKHGVAIVRPPGHHSHKNKVSGFCFFNNIAISAIHARNCGKRICVVDFDIHHSDGSENILKDEENIKLISIHRYDYGNYYPGTGKSHMRMNNIYNIPLNKLSGDEEYIDIFNTRVIPNVEEFKPDIILVSAGFDAGINDPLGGYCVTPEGFGMMTKLLLRLNKPIIMVLEGGYNLDTIAQSMSCCVKELLNNIGAL